MTHVQLYPTFSAKKMNNQSFEHFAVDLFLTAKDAEFYAKTAKLVY